MLLMHKFVIMSAGQLRARVARHRPEIVRAWYKMFLMWQRFWVLFVCFVLFLWKKKTEKENYAESKAFRLDNLLEF